MAGDWTKVEHATPDKPEVLAIAAALGIDADSAFGKVFRMWRWFDQHTENGNAPSVTPVLLDGIIGVTGFSHAVAKIGWLTIADDGLSLPNFNRHTSKTAKSRALTAKRVAASRSKSNARGNAPGNGASVTDALAREEKRRYINPPPPPPPNEGPGGGGGFSDLEDRLFRLDVRKAADATQSLRTHGATLDDVEGLLAEFEKRRGEFTAPGGALYTRLMAWRPGQSAEDLWPEDPEAAKRRKQRAHSKREKERVLREMEERRKESGRH